MNKKDYHAPTADVLVLHAPIVLFDASSPSGNKGNYEAGTQAGRGNDFADWDDEEE